MISYLFSYVKPENISLFKKLISQPKLCAFFLATSNASSDISSASTFSNPPRLFNAMAIAPEPVHISSIFLLLSPSASLNTSSTKISVSNLGISTFSFTKKGSPQKYALFKMYCIGIFSSLFAT